MIRELFPSETARSVFAIDYERLYRLGYRALLFDIDNTLVHHGDDSTPQVDALFEKINGIGFRTLMLSNNNEERILRFLKNIDADYIDEAGKPDPACYIEACSNIKDAVKNKWTSENSSRRKLNSMWQGNTYDDPMIYFTLIPNDVHDTKAVVRGGVHEYTGDYNIELIYLNNTQNQVEAREVTGTFPTDYVRYSFNRKNYDVEKDADMFDDLNNINEAKLLSYIKKVVKAELGTDAFMECNDFKVEARILENLEETARYNRNVNSSCRELNCMTERAFVDEVYYYINLIPDDVTTTPIVVKGAVEVATSEYDFTVYALTDDGKFKVSTLKGTFAESLTTPQLHENEAQLLKLVKDMLLQELGTDAFIECDDDKVVYAQINDLKDKAAFIKAQQNAERKRQNDIEFEREYGVKPEEWHPFNDLLNSANSSRRRRMK